MILTLRLFVHFATDLLFVPIYLFTFYRVPLPLPVLPCLLLLPYMVWLVGSRTPAFVPILCPSIGSLLTLPTLPCIVPTLYTLPYHACLTLRARLMV